MASTEAQAATAMGLPLLMDEEGCSSVAVDFLKGDYAAVLNSASAAAVWSRAGLLDHVDGAFQFGVLQ